MSGRPPTFHTPSGRGGDGGGGELRGPGRSGDVVDSGGRRGRGREEVDDLPSEEDIAKFGDVTQTCPECGKEVFDDTEICYHCGHALSTAAGAVKSSRWVVVTVVVIVTAFVLVAVLRVF